MILRRISSPILRTEKRRFLVRKSYQNNFSKWKPKFRCIFDKNTATGTIWTFSDEKVLHCFAPPVFVDNAPNLKTWKKRFKSFAGGAQRASFGGPKIFLDPIPAGQDLDLCAKRAIPRFPCAVWTQIARRCREFEQIRSNHSIKHKKLQLLAVSEYS